MDFQGVLGDLPQNAWHVQGFPHKDVFVVAEEVDERAFLFGGEHSTYAYRFTLGAVGVYEDLFASGASSVTSSLRVASSTEATIAAS